MQDRTERLRSLLQCASELQTLIEAALDSGDESLDAAVAAKTSEMADMTDRWQLDPTPVAEPIFYQIEETVEAPQETQEETSEPTAEEFTAEPPCDTAHTPEPMPEPEPQPEPQKTVGKLVFSVNDRFRFIRTLFGGSADDFNHALAAVAEMDSYEEAEDYFFAEKEWDPEDTEVEEFTEILRRYFNQ